LMKMRLKAILGVNALSNCQERFYALVYQRHF
jgi:hypothetical protein